MEWTPEDRAALLEFKKAIDCDDIKVKEQIKQVLLNNRFLIHVLNNQELEAADAEPDDYYGVNILPYYLIPTIQTEVNNFICYEVRFDELNRYNNCVKKLEITFSILCRNDGLKDEDTGVMRHDLLAALIQNDFNYTNYFGRKIRLISDVPNTTDTNYVVRTMIFEQITDNNVVKTRQGIPMFANKEIHTLAEFED